MNFLPLVQREMRTALRRPRTRRLRTGAATLAMAVMCWAILAFSGWTGGTPLGMVLLQGFTGSCWLCALLAGLFLTADDLSRERREGTLGLLFLTNLQAYDVVFGKLAAKFLVPFYCLLGCLPPLALLVVVGGVTGGEFWRIFLTLSNGLFFSLSLCLLASAWCRDQRQAVGAGLLMLLAVAGIWPMLSSLAGAWWQSAYWSRIFNLFTPTGSFLLAFDTSYQSGAGWFWGSLFLTHFASWGALLGASAVLSRSWREQLKDEDRPSQVFPRNHIMVGSQLGWPKLRPTSLDTQNPIAWLVDRRDRDRLGVWILAAAGLGFGIWTSLDPVWAAAGPAGLFAVHLLLKLRMVSDAAQLFSGERRTGTLEALLGTPLTVSQIVAGAVRGLRQRYQKPMLALLGLDLLLSLFLEVSGHRILAFMLAMSAVLFVVESYSLWWVGLWRSLVFRHSSVATLSAMGRILILPWVWFGVAGAIFQSSSAVELAGLWAVLTGLNHLVFWLGAKNGLSDHFRVLALRPFAEKSPHLESRWSAINWELDGPSPAAWSEPEADISR